MINVPQSISFLHYKDNSLFKIIMATVVAYTVLKGLYISGIFFSLVYVFRNYMRNVEAPVHYLAATVGFLFLAIGTGTWYPLALGFLAWGINKIFKTGKEIFWAEMFAGIPYLIITI